MGVLDAFNHLAGLVLPAFVAGPLAAVLARLVWRAELRGVGWRRLAAWPTAAAAIALVAGLAISGRDGAMATYGAMVFAMAIALWWVGFGPGRRR